MDMYARVYITYAASHYIRMKYQVIKDLFGATIDRKPLEPHEALSKKESVETTIDREPLEAYSH